MRATTGWFCGLCAVLLLPVTILAQRPKVNKLPPAQLKLLAAAIVEFATDDVVDNHAMFRDFYKPGNGDQFLNMAQAMTADLDGYLIKKGLVLPAWNPDMPIPAELAVVRREASGKSRPPLVNLDIDLPLPQEFRGRLLADFNDAQDLGDSLLPWHNKVQSKIGGSMREVKSAAATPIFWCWHAYISDLYTDWEQLQPPAAPAPPPPMLAKTTRRVANPPLKPVSIVLTNTHEEDIVIQLADRRARDARPQEIMIKPGQSKTIKVDRDAGGEDQVVLVNAAGEITEVLESTPIPPQPYYFAAVYEYKVVSVFIDRTKKGAGKQPDEIGKGLRSLGVFPLPAGEALDEGSELDPVRDAAGNNNPGAARSFPMPGR